MGRSGSPRFMQLSHRPEPSSVNSVLLHLKVQGLVVGSEDPSGLALVPHGGLEGPADRLLFSLRGRCPCDLLQRRVTRRSPCRFPCARNTSSSSNIRPTSFIHGSQRSSMSLANPLCHKHGCQCRSLITLPPRKRLVHRDLAARFNTSMKCRPRKIVLNSALLFNLFARDSSKLS